MKRGLLFLFMLIPVAVFAQADPDMIEIGKGRPWDMISVAAGAAGAAVISAIGKKVSTLVNVILEMWISKIRAKIVK